MLSLFILHTVALKVGCYVGCLLFFITISFVPALSIWMHPFFIQIIIATRGNSGLYCSYRLILDSYTNVQITNTFYESSHRPDWRLWEIIYKHVKDYSHKFSEDNKFISFNKVQRFQKMEGKTLFKVISLTSEFFYFVLTVFTETWTKKMMVFTCYFGDKNLKTCDGIHWNLFFFQ